MLFRDPILRLLPSTLPGSFETMDADEQAWRGRVFLMTWALGGDETVSWAMALNNEPTHVAEMKALAASASDDLIRDTVIERRTADKAASAVGINDLFG